MIKRLVFLAAVFTLVYACNNSESTDSKIDDSFNRGDMLKNYAENSIIPAFEDFDKHLKTLKTATTAFTNTPDMASLQQVRTAWLQAYKKWQHVAKFEIGKAEELQFVNHFNVYPVNVDDIAKNISEGTYDLNHPNNHDAQGFPALDYLLYGLASTDTEIVEAFSTGTDAAGHQKYLKDVVEKMCDINTQIVTDWKTYKNTFISSTDNTATSSLNKLVNDFVYYYEKRLRANKIGIPVGNFSADPLPEKVEGFYSKTTSKELALEALNSFQDFFEGKSYQGSTSGDSFKTYLVALNRDDLVTAIVNQLNKAQTAIQALDANFYKQITTDKAKMTKAYDELQKALPFLKTDMLQAFNVSVDYVDADGD